MLVSSNMGILLITFVCLSPPYTPNLYAFK